MRVSYCLFLCALLSSVLLAEPVEERYRSRAPGTVTSLSFSPDGRSIAVAGSAGRLYLLAAESGKERRTWAIPRSGLGAITFSPDGQKIAGGAFNALVVWKSDASDILHRVRTKTGKILSMAYSPDGQTLVVSGNDRKLHLLSAGADYSETRVLPAESKAALSLNFTEDSTGLLATIGSTAMVRNLKDPARSVSFKGHRGEVAGAALIDGGKHVLSGSINGSVMIWNTTNGKELHSDAGDRVTAVAGHTRSRLAATATVKKEIMIRRTDDGRVLHRITDLKRDVSTLAISPDGRTLVAGMRSPGDTLMIWALDVDALYAGEGNPGGDNAPEKVEYLTSLEAAVIREHNIARTDPAAYVKILKAYKGTYLGNNMFNLGGRNLITQEGVAVVDETIAFLEKQKPVSLLKASEGLSKASKAHTADLGPKGKLGHTGSDGSQPVDRISRFGKWEKTNGENIAFGPSEAQRIVMNLIVDDGVASRGHRLNIYNRDFEVIGVGIGPHTTYGHMCTMNYAGGFKESK